VTACRRHWTASTGAGCVAWRSR